MHIAIHCGGMPFNGDTIPSGQSLGGSESAAYYMARELAAMGHIVYCYTNIAPAQQGFWDHVRYKPMGPASAQFPMGAAFMNDLQAPIDVVVAQRHPQAFMREFNSKLNIWWLHDLALRRNAGVVQHNLPLVDKIFTVSEFHRQQVAKVWEIPASGITAVKNGVDYTAFADLPDCPREENSLVFAARPERGLEGLVGDGGVMEHLPHCHLYVCGYDNTMPHMADYYHYLWDRCAKLPNVTHLGPLGKDDLYRLLRGSMLYVYPTAFEDTSCIMVLEANAAGTPFVGPKIAALPETGEGGGVTLIPLKRGRVDVQGFGYTIKSILADKSRWQGLHKKALNKKQSWRDAAEDWTAIFEDLLRKKARSMVRKLRHLEKMSDITAIDKACRGDVAAVEKVLPDFRRNYAFFIKRDFAGHYARYYAKEKQKGVHYGPEDLWGEARFEQVAHLVDQIKPETLLDYGCAHGRYTMNLMRRFPAVAYTGVDINQSNIEIAEKWYRDTARRMPGGEFGGAEFIRGTADGLKGKFDVILLGEILEHVQEPTELTRYLMSRHLKPGGWVITTTPSGPWEWIGYADNPGWRAHIHHFERQDLFEMFGGQKDYNLAYLPAGQVKGEFVGHFVAAFQAGEKPIGRIDYTRKLKQLAPRETLCACIIVKNGEHCLGKTLESVLPAADQVVVGIDETTTDDTRRVAEAFGAECFDIPSPLEIGFDAARNLTIDRADTDWILWIDSDETLYHAERLKKYLRHNCFNGYALKQHHFSVDPAGLHRTDLPVRIFRNHQGIRFFGWVHEHPETAVNAGVGKVVLLNDVAIAHPGYGTEEIRRKRFARNLPLMIKDRDENPDRRLGKFLWARDLSHMIRYRMEQNGNAITAEIGGWAQQIIALWRDLLQQKQTRFVEESLPYYSHAVSVTGGGIVFELNLSAFAPGATPNGNGGGPKKPPIKALFACKKDIADFTAHMVAAHTADFEEKYF